MQWNLSFTSKFITTGAKDVNTDAIDQDHHKFQDYIAIVSVGW